LERFISSLLLHFRGFSALHVSRIIFRSATLKKVFQDFQYYVLCTRPAEIALQRVYRNNTILFLYYTYCIGVGYILRYTYTLYASRTTLLFITFLKKVLCKITFFYALEKKKHPAPLSCCCLYLYRLIHTSTRFTMKFYDLVRSVRQQ